MENTEHSQNEGGTARPSRLAMRSSEQDEKARAHAMRAMDPSENREKPPGMVDGSGVREEAAALYAAGRHQDASHVLTGAMQRFKGQVSPSLWYMLFDIYQATEQKLAFERLASLFAQAFEKSPPSWSGDDGAKNKGAGRNVMVVDGPISAINQDKLVDFLHCAREAKSAKLDLSRASLGLDPAARKASMSSLLSMLSRLRRYRIQTLLMGDMQLLEQSQVLRESEEDGYREAWMLSFELMQWHGQEDAFEDLALRYAMKFEESAPGYEPGQALAVVPGEKEEAGVDTSGDIQAPVRIDAANVEKFLLSLDHSIRANGKARIHMENLKLMTYDAATRMAAYLSGLGLPPDYIEALSPAEPVIALLEMAGASDFMHVSPRKR